MYLSKANVLMCNFLAKVAARKRPLASTLVFERIAKARDERHKQLLVEATAQQPQDDAATSSSVVTDPCDDLGLDADPVGQSGAVTACGSNTGGTKAAQMRRIRKKAKLSVPAAANVSIQLPGQAVWTMSVLMDVANKSPAIEATEENLQWLFDAVDNEITYGGVRRPRHGSGSTGERPRPKGEAGKRVYAVGRWWITKGKTHDAVGVGETPPPKKYKVLKRRRSGEASDQTTTGGKRRGAAAMSSAGVATGLDCLDL